MRRGRMAGNEPCLSEVQNANDHCHCFVYLHSSAIRLQPLKQRTADAITTAHWGVHAE
jgi:hypothetical protein